MADQTKVIHTVIHQIVYSEAAVSLALGSSLETLYTFLPFFDVTPYH